MQRVPRNFETDILPSQLGHGGVLLYDSSVRLRPPCTATRLIKEDLDRAARAS